MRILFLLIILLPSVLSAQDKIILKSFVKENGLVQLRWAPTSADIFQSGLKDGYTIMRSGSKGDEKFQIKPLKERKTTLSKLKDSTAADMIEFAESVANTSDEQVLKQSYGMLTLAGSGNKTISVITGVYFEDENVPAGNYTYRIQLNKSDIVSNEVNVKSNKKDENPDCSELTGFSRIDLKEAYMEWEAKALNPYYGGYFIYKSTDKKNFTKINSTPFFHFTSQYEPDKTVINYVDTTVKEGMAYYYRVQPINHFGDPGKLSNVVEIYIQKRLKGYCVIDTVEAKEYERRIVGFYEGKEDEVVKEFIFMRSDSINGDYKKLEKSSGTEKSFSFTYTADKLSGDRHYFKVAAVSPDGDSAYSYPYYSFSLDQEPPGIPTALEGIIDSNGVARLHWQAPEDDDLLGYRVFRANTLTEEFIEKTTRLDVATAFTDTLDLNNLTSEVYYYVRAVDQNYNNGENTPPVLLLKPDTIPPVPPVFKAYAVRETGVYLKWVNSGSSDVAQQFLVRQTDVLTDTVLHFAAPQDTLLDTSGELGTRYRYHLLVEDKSGNQARSAELPVTYEIGYRPAPLIQQIEANLEEKQIILKWEYVNAPIYSIQIYRKKNDGKYRLHATLYENATDFSDGKLSINNEYHYKIRIVHDNGVSSKMSEPVKVMY
ncbi:MAG: fibronectin type III domain-containing protein [Crocinitomicaceae bacterium]